MTSEPQYEKKNFTVAMDAYEPTRRYEYGVIEKWVNPEGITRFRIPNATDLFRDAHRALYLLDDGNTVVPHYVCGWNSTTDPTTIWIEPLPTNPEGKTDNSGRVIDYRDWALGPLRAYHLKLSDYWA